MRSPAAVPILTVLLALLSVVARHDFIEHRPLAGRMDGQEPEAHIIITEMAFDQVPWRTHHFLPLFTLGKPTDKFIDQHPGAASPDTLGNYYYTSTPPLTFVLPYIAAKLTVGPPTLEALRWYNVALGLLAAAALAALVLLCLRCRPCVPSQRTTLACTAAVIYLAAPESLKSHSIDIWAQQFTALLLPVQIISLLFYPSALLLMMLAAIGCLADWTPYVANAAMICLALLAFWQTRDRRSLIAAVSIAAGSVIGGLAMIAWFHLVMPVPTYFHDLAVRSGARAVGGLRANLYFLPRYLESFGVFTLVLATAVILWWRGRRDAPSMPRLLTRFDPLAIALVIFSAALLENPLMKDHALLYSYDRLKGVQLLALAVVWLAAGAARRTTVLYACSAAAAIASIGLFVFAYDTPYGWNYVAHSEQERLGALITRTAAANGPVFFNGEVRGSEIYYAGRNIFEHADTAAAAAHMDVAAFVRQWCGTHGFTQATLYQLSGDYPWPKAQDLPRSLTVTHVFTDGRASPPQVIVMDEHPGDYHPPQSSERFGHLPDRPWREGSPL